MKLSKIMERIPFSCTEEIDGLKISALIYDSRKVVKGSLFVCMEGARSDGHDYIDEVVEKGAAAIIVQREIGTRKAVPLLKVKNSREALALASAAYFGYPAEQLTTIGITGTKGKTTTAYMIWSALISSGILTGLIGTIETIINNDRIPAENTTPESYLVQESFRRMVDEGVKCVVMEVSSQGLMLKRVAGFTFDYGVFTNLGQDHIGPNEHKDLKDYIACKSLLFQNCRLGIVNIDDAHCKDVLTGHTCKVETFGLSEHADLRAANVGLHTSPLGLGIKYQVSGLLNGAFHVNIPGKFSVYNSLAAIAVCRHFDIPLPQIQAVLRDVTVKGRVEPVKISDRFALIIDYAHNAMSLESLLTTLKEYHPKRLVCMFGCGGNRSRDRRFEMGEISSLLADFTVVTSDNPRYEEPLKILEDVITGIKKGPGKYIAICDRKEAIRYCILNAKDGDVIILAGKGHEDYQDICGRKYHMDDREMIQQVIDEMTKEQRARL